MANSLAHLATNSRFALLEISDDDGDEGERNVSNIGSKNTKSGNKNETNSTDAGTAKSTKKSKRKKHKPKGNTDIAETTTTTIKEPEEWSGWMARDEQYVLSQFQRDMKAALDESKRETVLVTNKNTKAQAELVSEANSMTGGKEQRKKKEKAVAMSLDEFVSGLGAGKKEHTNQKTESAKQGGAHMMSLDSFAVMETTTTPVADTEMSTMWHQVNAAGSSHVHSGVETPKQETFLDEKPPQSTKAKKSSRKRDTSKSEEDSSKENAATQSSSEKKILTASKEDQLKREEMQTQAEIVLVQVELDKRNAMFEKLKKAFKKQNVTIEELKKELSQVKKRNKQLYFILSQGEMKEKSELVMQIEELNEVKEQVVQLHTELEQERSRSSVFKSELAKFQGRTWHGSNS